MSELAILGGSPVHASGWMTWPHYGPEELEQLKEVLEQSDGSERTWGGTLPCPKSNELAQKLAAYHDCRYGVTVSNGTAAIELALLAVGIEVGDEVLTTPMTWVATATAVLRAGGVPVFVDVDRESYTINPDLLEAAITPRTRAILPVHLSGYPARMDKIMELAEKHGLAVVEDCAQAHGTEYRGRKVGSFGDVGTFSFYQSKLAGAGEGGMIFTNNRDVWRRCQSYADCGRLRREERSPVRGTSEWYLDYLEAYEEGGWGFGWNYRLSEFQAAVLLAQADRLEEHKATRFRNATWLGEQLDEIDGIRPLPLHPGQNIWRYTMEYEPTAFSGLPLNRFLEAMQAEGIPTIHFHPRPLWKEGLFCGFIEKPAWSPGLAANPHDYGQVHCPVVEKAYDSLVILNSNVLLGSEQDMADIVAAVAKVQRHASELV